MKRMWHEISSLLLLFQAQLASQMSYRSSFLFDMLSTALITLFEFGALALVLQRFKDIDGWLLGEVAFLYGMVEVSFGLMDICFSGFDPPRFGQMIRLGRLDTMMTKPLSLTTQVLGSELEIRRIGRLVLGVGILCLAQGMVSPEWSLLKGVVFLAALLGMFLFFGSLFIIGSTVTFWTVNSIEVLNILTYGGSYMMSHPMSIYQEWMRRLFSFVIPAIFLNYYPVLFVLGKPDPYHMPAFAPFLSLFVGCLFMIIALSFWRFGLHHYTSTGS